MRSKNRAFSKRIKNNSSTTLAKDSLMTDQYRKKIKSDILYIPRLS